ncbi:peptidylprolyl isomerase [Pulveribacter suum]|uniref:peptidylprolyl isomerase n=1 Tax=Pulveribacter suum TaxID=2116657 RepID=A0A2P1NGT3_9BURK|nr:peptidylprolyl isomerase [Pulveribacter suum]AVP56251.1 peptidylprolyl isomerase [Pulveribacter suum]
MNATTLPSIQASINGVTLAEPNEQITPEELRQRACTELLRQAAQKDGLLAQDDPAPQAGAFSEAASEAIERWLEQHLNVPEPTEEACRRHHAAHAARYRRGERVHVRHILFGVTPGVDVGALRSRAEACLLDVRCHDGSSAEDAFARAARELSNCPTGAQGGELGWLTAEEFAPEMAQEIFGRAEVGVLPRLVHSRFGLHVVEVLQRDPGVEEPYESVRGAVQLALRQQSWITALRQCLQLLAAEADVQGVELDEASSPLVQ